MSKANKCLNIYHKYFIIDINIFKSPPDYIKILEKGIKIKNDKTYIKDLGEYVLYVGDTNVMLNRHKNLKLIFEKNKFYEIKNFDRIKSVLTCNDEFEQDFNIMDVYWDIFYFLNEKEKSKFERKIKLKKL